jgi:hypothetical protein
MFTVPLVSDGINGPKNTLCSILWSVHTGTRACVPLALRLGLLEVPLPVLVARQENPTGEHAAVLLLMSKQPTLLCLYVLSPRRLSPRLFLRQQQVPAWLQPLRVRHHLGRWGCHYLHYHPQL